MGESEKTGRFSCVDCGKNGCRKRNGDYPEFCEIPALTEDEIEKLRALYQDEENRRVAIASESGGDDRICTPNRRKETRNRDLCRSARGEPGARKDSAFKRV